MELSTRTVSSAHVYVFPLTQTVFSQGKDLVLLLIFVAPASGPVSTTDNVFSSVC